MNAKQTNDGRILVALALTLRVLSQAIEEAEIPLPMLESAREMIKFLNEGIEKGSIPDNELAGYVEDFRREWNKFEFIS